MRQYLICLERVSSKSFAEEEVRPQIQETKAGAEAKGHQAQANAHHAGPHRASSHGRGDGDEDDKVQETQDDKVREAQDDKAQEAQDKEAQD